MGTTLTAILFARQQAWARAYRRLPRAICSATASSTRSPRTTPFVQTLVDEGRITAEEAHSHPQRSLIMRALTGHEVEPTLIMREARAGDRYLLCSDGLSDPVSHETILEALQIPDVAESADRLIELALRGGGPDNVTVGGGRRHRLRLRRPDPAHPRGCGVRRRRPGRAAQHRGRTRFGIQPTPQRGQTRCAATGRAATQTTVPAPYASSLRVLLVLVVLAGLAVGREIVRSNYYVTEHEGTVSIMRGVQGSFLGFALQEPYLLGLSQRAK